MQFYLKQAKGEKDRYVGLSPVVLDILRSCSYINSVSGKQSETAL